MNGLREKFRNKKGFTLIEMLIVVAIIAILIAISIPMVGSALEGSRHGVDQANIRDAISLGSVEYLTHTDTISKLTDNPTYKYVVDETTHQGKLVDKSDTTNTETAVTCQCTCDGHVTDGLEVTIDKNTGAVTPNWTTDNTATGIKHGMTKTTSP